MVKGKSNNSKKADIIQLVLSIVILVIIAFVSSLFFTKFDLTEEKRHTLTESTKQLLEELDDVVFVRVYLTGNMEAKYKRLEQSIKEKLDEMSDYSDDNIEYEFIDIYESGDETTIKENEQALYDQGLDFARIANASQGGSGIGFQNIWPGAIITYKGRDITVFFLKTDNPDPTEELINSSIINLEYEFSSKLRQVMRVEIPKIGILEGHGELEDIELADLRYSLDESYAVERVEIDGKIYALSDKLDEMRYRANKYDLIIIPKPREPFSDKDRLVIDQFIMNGGKVLWMIDPMVTDLDSLRTNQQTFAVSSELGLNNMLFDYGVSMKRNLVIDYESAKITFDTGPIGSMRNMQKYNWYFAPVVLANDESHPIAANLDGIHLDFVSSLDVVKGSGNIEKTVLLKSSPYYKLRSAPARVHSGIVDFDENYFKDGINTRKPEDKHANFAVLLEGKFRSCFADFINDTLRRSKEFAFRDSSRATQMIVISDGDIAKSKVRRTQDGYMPLPVGYDAQERRVIYDNKKFVLNCVNYLLGDEEIISARSRTIKLRKLDATKVASSSFMLKIINVVIPLLIMITIGLVINWFRKRKYV